MPAIDLDGDDDGIGGGGGGGGGGAVGPMTRRGGALPTVGPGCGCDVTTTVEIEDEAVCAVGSARFVEPPAFGP